MSHQSVRKRKCKCKRKCERKHKRECFTIVRLYDEGRCPACFRPVREYYMVHDAIWCQVTRPEERELYLHIRCLELRLGRKLTPKDFTSAPVNHDPEWIARMPPILLNRLGKKRSHRS